MRRKIIAALLGVSCLVSAVILVFTEPPIQYQFSSLDELDELIITEMEAYNISKDQVRIRNVEFDSTFTRKTLSISLHPSYSKTQIHHSIHTRLSRYKLDTPAKLELPDKDMTIFVYDGNTVIRTIYLNTDQTKEEDYGEE